MKKFFVILSAFVSILTLSCNKHKDETTKQQEEVPPGAKDLPRFDESNSAKVTWDQLPSELKNATPVKSEEPNKAARLSEATYSWYSYYVGPWGGGGGYSFWMFPPSGSRIYAIAVKSGTLIDRLTVWYMTSNGSVYVAGDVGGDGGYYFLQYFASDEFIYYVSGRSGQFLNRLTMYTNRKSFSYGGTGGSPFSVIVPGGYQVLGFFGAAGQYVDRLGFYVFTR